jgi:XTP/dITP diphosphohydrolase
MAETKELIFGTTNKAKIDQIQGALGTGSIVVRGIGDFGINIDIPENGKTAKENAKKKAVAYAHELGRTVFAMDNALYFKGLGDDQQPGLYVRRVGGLERSSDEEMIHSYVELIETHGGRIEGWWEFGLSIAQADGSSVEDSIISPRLFVSKASDKVVPGYPLESIQIEPDTGKYVSEMSEADQAAFWQRSIGEPLARFIDSNV